MKTVVIDNAKVNIDASNILGVGGEATVVKLNGLAVKLYKTPSKTRADKLLAFLKLGVTSKDICSPIKAVYDTAGQIVGYAMNQLSPQFEVMQMLTSKSYRKSHPAITSASITDVLLSGHDTISELHKHGIIIGDNNDLNAWFWQGKMKYTDVDSFQFQQFPCMVATENFLDPRLYDVDLTSKPMFITLDDWYSWFVMYIRSILMVHPYGGTHKSVGTIPLRAKKKITVFDSEVNYPKPGFHPNLLNDDLKVLFEKMFKKGERFVPDKNVFISYRDSLRTCPSCGTMYPGELKNCPQCSHTNIQVVQRKTTVVMGPKQTVNSELIFSTQGQIIWKHLSGQLVFLVTNEHGKLVLHKYAPNARITTLNIGNIVGSPKFEIFGDKYLAYNDGMSDEVRIIDIDTQKVITQDVDSYQGERVFSGGDGLLTVHNGQLCITAFNARYNRFMSTIVSTVSLNQTWIKGSRNLIFGCQRFFDISKFFTYSWNTLDPSIRKLWYVPIPELPANESIIDTSILFSGNYILLLRKTERKGQSFVRIYIIHDDKITYESCVESRASEIYKNIHGKAFMASSQKIIILHPTDDGIVREVIQDGKSQATVLPSTDKFVAESDSIDQYNAGVLVVGDQTVNYLTMNSP